MRRSLYFVISFIFGIIQMTHCQNISLFEQFNGQYDFLMLGNTMNIQENTANDPCFINTTSSANLFLSANSSISGAYLYWAGSGTGDFNVTLNGTDITAARIFNFTLASSGLPFFSAFANVTALLQASGPGSYTLSNLDVSPWLNAQQYCNNGTNFAGWAIVVVYQNDTLPLNQLNIYDGLQGVPTSLTITLDSLNVIDDIGAQIGFVAWEGDQFIANGEVLTINGTPIGNPPLNPVNNAFNGTNSYTGSTMLYNMDLDVYDIQNNIAPGDNTAQISLSSAQDFVMINCIVTKLNSQLPDATATIDAIQRFCDSRTITLNYSIANTNATEALPEATPIAIYLNGVLVANSFTTTSIPVGGSVPYEVTLTIPDEETDEFTITVVADDQGGGTGVITELDENNNGTSTTSQLIFSPALNTVSGLVSCNLGNSRGVFDFSSYDELIRTSALHNITFHQNEADALSGINAIGNVANYEAFSTPADIWVRVNNGDCSSLTHFPLTVKNCPPTIYNYISANNDGVNDNFFIDGLRDVFLNYRLEIYNRWGAQVWEGDNTTGNWDGTASEGLRVGGNNLPDGTYYYVLYLNDPDYPTPIAGYIYLNR